MKLPPDIVAEVEAALSSAERGPARITHVRAVSGGCISNTARLETNRGGRAFLKWHDAGMAHVAMFAEEARSLRALEATGAVRVPAVLGASERFLLLEWLEPGEPGRDAWAKLGRDLAGLHRITASAFGWEADNFIGSLPQSNDWSQDWPRFWRERRLEPQLRAAYDRALLDRFARRRIDLLLGQLDDLLKPAATEGASLLHGDLWNGNVHAMRGGAIALIDPSSYYGHREVDLAMAELFEGFGTGFFDAYEEAWPLGAGARGRRAIYQFYYLLVHLNLFGAAYAAGARAAVEAALLS